MLTSVAPLEEALHLVVITHLLAGLKDQALLHALRDMEDPNRESRQERAASDYARAAYDWATANKGTRDNPGKDPATALIDSTTTALGLFAEIGIPGHLDDHAAWMASRTLRAMLVWLVTSRGYVTARQRLLDAVEQMRGLVATQVAHEDRA